MQSGTRVHTSRATASPLSPPRLRLLQYRRRARVNVQNISNEPIEYKYEGTSELTFSYFSASMKPKSTYLRYGTCNCRAYVNTVRTG